MTDIRVRTLYNYGLTPIRTSSDMFGLSVFAKDANGDISTPTRPIIAAQSC